jgi:hypothetical protein
MQNVFGNDLEQVRIVGEGSSEDEDSYVLVKCRNYHDHSEALRASKRVSKVLESFDNPTFLSEKDVDGFFEKPVKHDRKEFERGDVVVVNRGYLSQLTGIVVSKKSRNRYGVFFRFHMRSFCEVIPASWMEFRFNFFNGLCHGRSFGVRIRHPVTWMSKEDLKTIRRFLPSESGQSSKVVIK